MVAFPNSIDKIYDRLSNLDEASFKDIGKAALPAAAIGAMALGTYNILNHPETIESMTPKERYDHALAEYQHPIVVDPTADLSIAAQKFSKYWISLSAEEQTKINHDLREYRQGGVPNVAAGRLKEFETWVKYWIDFENDQKLIDQWATSPDGTSAADFDYKNRLRKRVNKKENTMKTFEDAYTHWVPPSVEEDNYRHERTVVKVPGPEKGEPWVHSDDDFLFFLDWLVKKGWEAQKIVDVVREPHHFTKPYGQFLDQRDREISDPLL